MASQRRKLIGFSGVLIAILLVGCTFQMKFNRPYVEYSTSKLPVLFKGKALVVTTPEADMVVTSQPPSSFSGGGNKSPFDSGLFCRDTALLTFSKAFELGAEHRSSISKAAYSQVTVIIEPRMVSFDYKNTVEEMKTRHTARTVLAIKFHFADGTVIERSYDSGYVTFGEFDGHIADNQNASLDERLAVREILFSNAFVVAYQYALKDMESFMPKKTLLNP